MKTVAKLMPRALLAISAVLAVWGAFGLLEYFAPSAQFGLQDPKFPAGLQFLHFAAILTTGATFVLGYAARWRGTPFATIVMYAVLATLCFIETVDFESFGGGQTRFIPMTIEYVAYVGLSVYLLRSKAMRRRFSSDASKAPQAL